MKIRQKIIGSLLALGAFGTLLGPGCADNRSSIFVIGALAVPQDTCAWESTDANPLRPAGRLDLALSQEYWIPILVGNQLVKRGNAATLRTETSHVSFYEAEVNLTDSAGAAIPNGNFVVPVTGFAEAAANTDPGFGSAAVTLIDPTSAQSIKPGMVPWAKVFAGAKWFHVTGITPALSKSAAAATLESMKAAKAAGADVVFGMGDGAPTKFTSAPCMRCALPMATRPPCWP